MRVVVECVLRVCVLGGGEVSVNTRLSLCLSLPSLQLLEDAPTQPMKDAVFGSWTIHWHTRIEFCVEPPDVYSTS